MFCLPHFQVKLTQDNHFTYSNPDHIYIHKNWNSWIIIAWRAWIKPIFRNWNTSSICFTLETLLRKICSFWTFLSILKGKTNILYVTTLNFSCHKVLFYILHFKSLKPLKFFEIWYEENLFEVRVIQRSNTDA